MLDFIKFLALAFFIWMAIVGIRSVSAEYPLPLCYYMGFPCAN